MDGWNKERVLGKAPQNAAYSYVFRDEIAPYWEIANQYVLSDDTFASNLDGSFVAHQYTVAAYSSSAVDFPSSLWGCDGGSGDTIGTLTLKRKKGRRSRRVLRTRRSRPRPTPRA